MTIEENIPLAPLTTFRIGGAARYFAKARSERDIMGAIAFARDNTVPLLIIGGGSNILPSDDGFQGLVLRNEIKGIDEEERAGSVYVRAGAGVGWDELALHAVSRGLWGIENLSGIPGTVGAAPVQNIGAYGAELSETLESLEAVDLSSGTSRHFNAAACGLGYRTSMFKRDGGYAITKVTLRLSRAAAPRLTYRDLAQAFEGNTAPALGEIRKAVLAIRAKKFPDLEQEGTAGSFFLNPVVDQERAALIRQLLPQCPQFPAQNGVKLPLAYLLDEGLHLKGFTRGPVRLFERQPIVLVAQRGASAKDVRELASLIVARVESAYGIRIEPEVRILS